MKMNPSASAPKGDNNATDVPAGRYGLALVWFQRRTPKAGGKQYLSVRYEITDGPLKGQSFFSMMGLDLEQRGTFVRWSLMCEVCQVDEEFELGDEDEGTETEGDANIARLFKNRPFRAEVSRKTKGGYVNNGVERIIPRDRWTDEENRLMQIWETEKAEERDDFGIPPGDDAPTDTLDDEIDDRADEGDDGWDIKI